MLDQADASAYRVFLAGQREHEQIAESLVDLSESPDANFASMTVPKHIALDYDRDA
ncbi:hypothetical protein D3C71_1862330 [compost metagenome]